MFDYRIEFESPIWLLLLVAIPLVWLLSYRSLAGLGPLRRLMAIFLRTVVLVALVLALAEAQMVRTSSRVAVVYLLDQSLSIPQARREAMRRYINDSIVRHRRDDDYAGVIVFGRDAAIEVPPFDDEVQLGETIESLFDPKHTNLAEAMRLAQASFPEDAAKRIVIVSDGNENLGDALAQAHSVVDSGIGVDVMPIRYASSADVLVERIAVPSDVRRGQPFDLRVIVGNTAEPTADDTGRVSGRLVITEESGDEPRVLSDERVTLAPGKNPFSIRQIIDRPGAYRYAANFVPDDLADDALSQNNRATGYAYVRGRGQVLFIINHEEAPEHDFLIDVLADENLEVTVQPTDQLFTDPNELQPFDTVVLANVPREYFSDHQIKMLVRNTEQFGSGLVMLGGPNSFGAGGWLNTEIEKAMPVDFQIKASKVLPRGALALIMHASEMAQGNYWQKVVAKEAIRTLSNQDYCGLLHRSGNEQWLWRPGMRRVGGARERMLSRVDRMTPGDMPDFDPTLRMAHRGLAALKDAAVKHIIVISDGDPSPPSPGVIQLFKDAQITVSTVEIASHGVSINNAMENLATATGGKYYAPRNPKNLPRIFQREARRVTRPLIYSDDRGFRPSVYLSNELVSGIEPLLPPITGFVMTTVKQNPLVEVSLVSPVPTGREQNNTILASWPYGLGRAVAFTSDTGARWTTPWTEWEGYNKLHSQIVRWSMRPGEGETKFIPAVQLQDGIAQVVVTALDKDDAFLNFLELAGTVVGPDMETTPLQLEQTAPGRYKGTFRADDSGSYFITLSSGPDEAPLRLGLNVPYSAEFRRLATNELLLQSMASLEPRGGRPGQVIEDTSGRDDPETLLAVVDPFRRDLPKAKSHQDVWHLLVLLGGCMFFFDVFVRRVALSFAWVGVVAGRVRDRVLRRRHEEETTETMQRLQRRKEEIEERLEQRLAGVRFESEQEAAETDAVAAELDTQTAVAEAKRPGRETKIAPEESDEPEESYTERLLRAKRKIREGRELK